MRSSNKSRSRNKNNRGRSNLGNIVNRVFDSSGPEGKVRGTPQQIIDKYQTLARDAQLSGDRVAAENFLQHSEHYLRLLGEAQREMNERREAQEAQRQQNQQNRGNGQGQQQPHPQQAAADSGDDQPDISASAPADLFPGQKPDAGLVETPETSAAKKSARKPRKPKSDAPTPEVQASSESADGPQDMVEAKEA